MPLFKPAPPETLDLNQAKAETLRLLQHYEHYRKQLDCYNIVRDRSLLAKKYTFIEKTIADINDFDGSKADFLDLLKAKVSEHAALSRDNGKNHYNLDDASATKWVNLPFIGEAFQVPTRLPRSGELLTSSDLAGLLHKAIRAVQNCTDTTPDQSVSVSTTQP